MSSLDNILKGDYEMKICISCAAGGHLDQLMNIMRAFAKYEIFFVTVESETTKSLRQTERTYYIKDSFKPIQIGKIRFYWITAGLYYFYLTFPCIFILFKERPTVIFGNGGSSTLLLSYVGKIIGCKIIYLESLTRVTELSLTGKLVYPIADLFLVQWESLLQKYGKAKYWGKVI